jgi:hypothetical protein
MSHTNMLPLGLLCRFYEPSLFASNSLGMEHLISVTDVEPDAVSIAAKMDYERAAVGIRSLTRGISVLFKDNSTQPATEI